MNMISRVGQYFKVDHFQFICTAVYKLEAKREGT